MDLAEVLIKHGKSTFRIMDIMYSYGYDQGFSAGSMAIMLRTEGCTACFKNKPGVPVTAKHGLWWTVPPDVDIRIARSKREGLQGT